MTPLSDEAFDENAKASYDTNLRAAGRKWEALNELIADARWHRAELAKVKAENEALRKLVAMVAEQQAIQDDWWIEELAALGTKKEESDVPSS